MSLRTAALVVVFVAAVVAVVVATGAPTRADDNEIIHTVYISVTGRGPNAKSWYKGAPPAGIPVQDAFDHFSEKGYHVVEVRPAQTDLTFIISPGGSSFEEPGLREDSFIVLLQKP